MLYQLLWSLTTLGPVRASEARLGGKELESVTLILEPSAGGDQHEIAGGRRIVTQLKARSDGGTWSLQEVVRDVLPDLCLAVDPDREAEYHFVTEGRRGDWEKVEAFFRDLPALSPEADPLGALPDEGALKFARGTSTKPGAKPFWDAGAYTPRKLFLKIVEAVRVRKPTRELSEVEARRRTWNLLRGFRFVGGQTHEGIRFAVDRWLTARVACADQIEKIRDHMLLDLGRRACVGDATISAEEFFAAHGLDGTPLTEWLTLSQKSIDYLDGLLRRKGIDLAEEVRPGSPEALLGGWSGSCPILVLSGESGGGKTWLGYQLMASAVQAGNVAVLVE